MATRSGDAKKRFLEHADVWSKVIEKHDEFVKQLAVRKPHEGAQRRAASASRRLSQLYSLFEKRTPSVERLDQWLAPSPPRAIEDFKFVLLHRALTTAIEIASTDRDAAAVRLPKWMYSALKQPEATTRASIVQAATEGPAMTDARGPSASAIELLADLGFGSDRTIWRRLERHRKSMGEKTPRPHRPRRPVPTR